MTRRRSRGELPLIAWGETQRIARDPRRKLRRVAFGIAVGIAALGLTIALPPPPRLLWNASASAPIGLYYVSPGTPAAPSDMAIARLPAPWRGLAARRHYLPANVPLVKRVAAAAGDEVCAFGTKIFVNDRLVAERRTRDPHGRGLPWWRGCVHLHGRQLLLLTDRPDSFDGRYFGVIEGADVIGTAVLLWRR